MMLNGGADTSKELGKWYIIDSTMGGCDYLVYSIIKKKLYWINFEHCDCEVFHNDFPYNSREFEELAYAEYNGDEGKRLKAEVIALFKKYNEEHNIKLFD